jgi:hypothetical protein
MRRASHNQCTYKSKKLPLIKNYSPIIRSRTSVPPPAIPDVKICLILAKIIMRQAVPFNHFWQQAGGKNANYALNKNRCYSCAAEFSGF